MQRTYNLDTEQKHKTFFPPELLTKQGMQEKVLFGATSDASVVASIALDPQSLETSKGGRLLIWGKHATFMRIDAQRRKFFFFEPNIGTLVFSPKPSESLKDLALRMATAYIELYQWAYPKRDFMSAHQIIPAAAGQPETNLDQVPIYG